MGSDLCEREQRIIELVSIHAPAWSATGLVSQTLYFRGVSIHAPTWGATLQYILVEPVALFQPTLPHGERREYE